MRYFKQAADQDDPHQDACYCYGNYCYHLTDYHEAITYLTKCQNVFNSNGIDEFHLAEAHLQIWPQQSADYLPYYYQSTKKG